MHHRTLSPTPRRRRPLAGPLIVLGSLAVLWHGVADGQASEQRRSPIVVAVEQARPAIVNIHGQKTLNATYDEASNAESGRRVNGMGTGVVVDPRGYIITNHHVVQGVRRIQVTMADGKTHFARLLSYDPRTDLAVIKVDLSEKLPVIKLGTSCDLMTGETVIAVGNAYGYEHTVTRGIVSALHRTVQINDTQQYEDLIQTDASINPGNSGGPLLNIDGEMIGLNVAVRAGAQGIGFAIPIDKVLEVMAELLSAKKLENHWHGLTTKSGEKLAAGVVVAQISPSSPAEKGGFQPGDVIAGVAGEQVVRAFDFERMLLGRKPGEEIEVVVKRGDRKLKLPLALAPEKSWDVLGIRVAPAATEQLRRLNARYRGGLLVSEVREDSPAYRAGIRSDDILVGMHNWETISVDNLSYVLNRLDSDEIHPLKFYIVRGEETLYGHLSVARTASSQR